MKFLMAMFVYAAAALLLAWGILAAVKGNPWVLATVGGIYLLLLATIGCLPQKSEH